MYWTLELASKLEDAPWPATKDELIDYAIRSGAPLEVMKVLRTSGLIIPPKKISFSTRMSISEFLSNKLIENQQSVKVFDYFRTLFFI